MGQIHRGGAVDGLWAVAGTTNLDMLSFEYLDEINIAVRGGERRSA